MVAETRWLSEVCPHSSMVLLLLLGTQRGSCATVDVTSETEEKLIAQYCYGVNIVIIYLIYYCCGVYCILIMF